MRLSVVIPAWNEAQRIGDTLRRVVFWLAFQHYPAEIVVVDDGSTDDTSAVVLAAAADSPVLIRLARLSRNCGKGAAVREGMLCVAQGEYRLLYDADGSTPIEMIDRAWPLLESGADIVIGSRALPDADIARHQAWYREQMGKLNNALLRLLGLTTFRDTQCGFKVFSASAAEAVFSRLTISRFSFDAEALYIAQQRGLRVEEIPVHWENDPKSSVHPVRDSLRMVFDMLLIRLRATLGGYR
jgi:dolichyl-phosphate beta-glucosyltransferase